MTDKPKRDAAVDAFAAEIKKRLDDRESRGYTGWTGEYPSRSLCKEIELDVMELSAVPEQAIKAVDIGARAMMLYYRTVNGVFQR